LGLTSLESMRNTVKTPFFDIAYEDEQGNYNSLNEKYRIHFFEFDEDMDKDNMLTLRMQGESLDVLDESAFRSGELLRFRFGIKEDDSSARTRIAEVLDFEPDIWNDLRVDVTIRAMDKGAFIRHARTDTVWKKKTASEIAQAIAGNYEYLEAKIDNTTKIYKQILQKNKSDFDFLKYLASLEENIGFWVTDNQLIFAETGFEEEPVKNFTLGNPNSGVIKFSPRIKKSDKKDGADNEVSVSGIDEATGEEFTVISNTSKEKSANNYTVIYDVNGKEIKKSKQKNYNKGRKISSPSSNKSDLQKQVNKKNKKKKDKGIEATLHTDGNTDIELAEIITIGNVGKMSGNHKVTGINYSISGGSLFSRKLRLISNATSKPHNSDNKESNVNKQAGADKKDTRKEIKVVKYDGDGIKK